MIKFAREGFPFILTFASITLMTVFLGKPWLTVLALVPTLFMFFFFRDPERDIFPHREIFYSPADGKIILIKEAMETELLNKKALVISIFMSPFDVHINRAPCDGIVKEVRYYRGRFFSAFKDKAQILNEHITMLLENEYGSVVIKQIAGSIARRVVCRAKPGDVLKQGERYGLIKFSSRVDVYLPLNTEIKVKLNDKVKAGVSILGIIK
jgi:phosphatidylserine decarboxylase